MLLFSAWHALCTLIRVLCVFRMFVRLIVTLCGCLARLVQGVVCFLFQKMVCESNTIYTHCNRLQRIERNRYRQRAIYKAFHGCEQRFQDGWQYANIAGTIPSTVS